MSIRVCLVENETLVRQGLRRVLELDPELVVVGEARDGEEALRIIAATQPDVVLLDVRMPRLDGLGVLRALRGKPPCLLFTTFDDPDVVLDGIRAGARGFLLKDVTFEVLAEAIRALAAGRSFLQPSVTERVLRGLDEVPAHPDLDHAHERLTDRELEVLRLLAGGYSNAEIAGALGVAERTVKNHVSAVLGKLYVRDRTRAVLKALALGLL